MKRRISSGKASRAKATGGESKYLRNGDAAGDAFPGRPGGIGGPETLRELAIEEIARRMPEDAIQALGRLADSFCWFLPPSWTAAMVQILPATYEEQLTGGDGRPWTDRQRMPQKARGSRVLYLSAAMEAFSLPVCIAIVAHELAHIACGHAILWRGADQYDRQEKEAWAMAGQWGFDKEIAKYWAHKKRQTAAES